MLTDALLAQAIAQIVAGKKLANGALASFVGVQPPAKDSKRALSATRRLQVRQHRVLPHCRRTASEDLDQTSVHELAALQGTASFVGVQPPAKDSRRALSATRRLQVRQHTFEYVSIGTSADVSRRQQRL